MLVTAIALEAMLRDQGRVDLTAARLARIADPQTGEDSVDLSREMVAVLAARTDFELQTKVVRTAEEMQDTLLDTFG